MIELLLITNKFKTLVNLIAIKEDQSRPKFISMDEKKYNENVRKVMGLRITNLMQEDEDDLNDPIFKGTPELSFRDIILIALEIDISSDDIVELIRLMQNEGLARKMPDYLL